MPVCFDIDLDTVQRIRFIFRQLWTTLEFEYPSQKAYRGDDANTIVLEWDQNDTWKFDPKYNMQMDTTIDLIGSDVNPETPIIDVSMLPTLFKRE